MLDTKELLNSIENIRSVKKLKREDSSFLDINPLHSIILGEDLSASTVKSNPYLGVIFAYDSIDAQTLIATLNQQISNGNKFELPDFIFCLEKKYMIFRAMNNDSATLDTEFNNFGVLKTGDDTISLMFLTINGYLSNIRLKSVNYRDYWVELFTNIASKQ